ncbi:hypothetical protein NSZ01_29290 [Nocardioides szechwanensis]|uniref:Uncharacterized conserved protein, DUF58 family, contains vWF domain n=1 Tax=Nocardioides szechwanensis TaxID=1005944 RepID=A0A1H0DJH3_9ACTN|nr:DUF58 domain-containing protein [Nocardioides szechwanensis]GEP35161.1 hypothetical protein NSZ01_29290 [Nocardioides szechwanensis]SDN70161.1 Uncharacterized conserved protein, DUF58 family, contains vWF domain [Nocardioides szechwanensis]
MTDVRRTLRRVRAGVTPAGRAVICLGAFATLVAAFAGYDEFRLIAIMCALLVLVALVLFSMPTRVRARLQLHPAHTIAGETGVGDLEVTNLRLTPMYHPLVSIPLDAARDDLRGAQRVHVRMPVLRRGETTVERFEVPAVRRGVLQVGPAGVRRTDPLGFFQRHAVWAQPVDLYVRPRMVRVESLGTGSVRDLEGIPSDQISMSDLSFHALREYVVGDDLRHVHWRSSARTGRLYVRQYHDTRRSHTVVLVDDDPAAYADPEDFELALSIAASVVMRVALEQFALTLVCGPQQLAGSPHQVLDAFCLSELAAGSDLRLAAATAARMAPDASQLIVVSGGGVDPGVLSEVRRTFPDDVQFLAFRADPGSGEESPAADRPHLLTVSVLEELPGLLGAYVRGVVL